MTARLKRVQRGRGLHSAIRAHEAALLPAQHVQDEPLVCVRQPVILNVYYRSRGDKGVKKACVHNQHFRSIEAL